ncbi:MAG: 50S ribosomal protein L9 [Chloroflexi bacterium]|nr:50S ribosomal protein L9 [Chloroflexota bacterium]
MKVVLVQEVEKLGFPGDIKEVKDGYARNYLIPKGLAVLATPPELQKAEARHRASLTERAKFATEMKQLAQQLESQPLSIPVRVGPEGRLYGSVTAAAIAEALTALTSRKFDHKAVELAQPLRELGDHSVRLRLAPETTATVVVRVEAQGGLPSPEVEESAENAQAPQD